MSIRDVINDWIRRGDLFLVEPALDSDPMSRTLFVSRDIYNAITDLGEGRNERMGRLRAQLEVFVRGELVTVAMEPFRARHAYMARLHPRRDEIWEIRDRFTPSIRVFGSFSEFDTFVALTWQWRWILGGIGSHFWPRVWSIERRACRAAWRRNFPSYLAHTGNVPHEYLSNWFPVGDPNRWES